MFSRLSILFVALSFCVSVSAKEQEFQFQSPNGITEYCVALSKIPGGQYSNKDLEKELEFCSIDLHRNNKVAMCPKTWSTSPATMIYSLSESEYTQSSYESSNYCGKKSKASGVKTLAKFKNSMNQSNTSGTFSQSSLLYYHFSRYFDMNMKVPVSVYREIDRNSLYSRVIQKGDRKTSKGQIAAGWNWMTKAAQSPNTYKPTRDIVTDDHKKFYGILIRGKGERYSKLFYGHRPSWGLGDAQAFEDTPHYQALRDPSPLPVAIEMGIQKAKNIRRMRPYVDENITDQQMLLWMRDVVEMTLLDFIFSQQDRIGNIDYQWYWYYNENGKTKRSREKRDAYKDLARSKMHQIPVPEKLAHLNPELLQVTNLNDNDAGGRIPYVNWAKPAKAGWLLNMRHYSAKIFTKLMNLDYDLQNQGPVYQWLVNHIDLTPRQVRQIVINTNLAAESIRSQCEDMVFDLDDVDNFLSKGFRKESVNCADFRSVQ